MLDSEVVGNDVVLGGRWASNELRGRAGLDRLCPFVQRRGGDAAGEVKFASRKKSLGQHQLGQAGGSTPELAGERAVFRKLEAFVAILADLFNGRDFQGWAGPTNEYEIIAGAIQCRPGKGGTIYTTDEYSDFMTRLEIKLPSTAGAYGYGWMPPGFGPPSAINDPWPPAASRVLE